jgi:hypothetical protein
VGPALQDSCADGNDDNCNGVPNEGCACINGGTRACGPDTEVGACQRGTETCAGGLFGPCLGAVFPGQRNCASPQDNDCDGRPDNTIDNTCAPPLVANGAGCAAGNQCESGICTDGFCCAGPCSGVCATCQPGTGACIAPADDPRCQDVTCSGVCKVAETLTSAMCRGVNQCKTTADCPTLSDADNRTPCGPAGSHQRCFNGSCSLPTVLCGGINQQVTTASACCEILGGASGPREEFTTLASCPPSELESGELTTPITCDGVADCPLGEACCLRSALDSAIECTPEAECTGPGEGFRTICSSPQGVVNSCQEGTCGTFFLGPAFITGWGFCG